MSLDVSYDSRKVARENSIIQPTFGRFQLIGDNLFVHFADQILHQHHEIIHGKKTVGYCVSGQRIDQLCRRLKLRSYPLSTRVMVLIGTSDVLNGGNIHTMTRHFSALLRILRKTVDELLLVTLPPIPRLCVTYHHWTLIRGYNTFLKSLDNGRNVRVADVCPVFTKFKAALEFEMVRDLTSERMINGKRRKSFIKNHRKVTPDIRKPSEGSYIEWSESDYRNTTETSTSSDSEAPSSEFSQELELVEKKGTSEIYKKLRKTEPARFVVKTLQSVLGKEVLIRKMSHRINQPEKRQQKNLSDAADSWMVESDEDSMSEHVYKSQEEIDFDPSDVIESSNNVGSLEFSKFLESCNDTPKKSFCSGGWKRDIRRNEEPDDTESSTDSDFPPTKKNARALIDHDFRYFLEDQLGDCSPSPSDCHRHFSVDDANDHRLEQIFITRNGCGRTLHGFKNITGISERDKLLLRLANKICHLRYYELFSSFNRSRLDLVQLNYRGLNELKNFLVRNDYASP